MSDSLKPEADGQKNPLVQELEGRADLDTQMEINSLRVILHCHRWNAQHNSSFQRIVCEGKQKETMSLNHFLHLEAQTLRTLTHLIKGENNLLSELKKNIANLEDTYQGMDEFPKAFICIQRIVCSNISKAINLNYRIQPSAHCGATILQVSSIQTVLDDKYTLDVPDKKFRISFYSEGEPLGCFDFDFEGKRVGKEIREEVTLAGITVFLIIKYANNKQAIHQQISTLKEQLNQHSMSAAILERELADLRQFRELFKNEDPAISDNIAEPYAPAKEYTCITNVVKNCYYVLQLQILLECLCAFCTPVSFLKICVLFYLILYIHATSPEKLQLVFGLGILGYFLLSLLTVLVVFLRVGVEGGSLGLVYASLASGVLSMGMMMLVMGSEAEFEEQAKQFILGRR